MTQHAEWQWDETVHVGADYADPAEAAAYDVRHAKFRDAEQEGRHAIAALGLAKGQILLDMGAGTGALVLQAAERCERVYAVDISAAMLDVAREKAVRAGLSNVEFHRAGFLTYQHEGAPADAIVSQYALHHLPDFWKLIALRRLAGMLTPGGRLFLKDMVYSFDTGEYSPFLDGAIRGFAEQVNRELAGDFVRHIREEYSTLDWVMEGVLARAGFVILEVSYSRGLFAEYLCGKRAD